MRHNIGAWRAYWLCALGWRVKGLSLRHAALLAITLGALTAPAAAGIIAYDGFDYAIGDLNGNNGGTGNWQTAWTANTAIDVVSASLSYSGTGFTVGGGTKSGQITSLTGTAVDDVFDRQFTAQTGPVYFSLLFQAAAGLDSSDFVTFMLNNDTNYNNTGALGLRNDSGSENGFFARLRTTSDSNYKTNTQGVGGTTYFLVGKLYKSGAGNYDRIDFWLNPTSLTEPAATVTGSKDIGTSSVSYLTCRVSGMEVGDQFQFDELRIGTTWGDVLPEPATLALVGLGMLLAFRRRR
jgi:hypothetical protein